jgi:alanine dehydrogenase
VNGYGDVAMALSIGLPRMHKEAGERRDFLPRLVGFLDRMDAAEIVVEEGYGSGMDIAIQSYLDASSRCRVGSYEECLAQDVVVVVRYPGAEIVRGLRPGTCLVSMLHFPTRPERVQMLEELGIRGVSLDGVTDDLGRRLVENVEAVGWNGVREAFKEIQKIHPRFAHPSRRPLRVTCLGAGAVGAHAIRAATRYGDPRLREEMVAARVPGVEVTVADFDLTWHENYMLTRLEQTDLLIDATQREDPTRVIVPNDWVAALPQDAVILDLSVDPYDFSVDPPKMKGIDGVPEGDLDQYVFRTDDPAYERLPEKVETRNRRVALACYSWPGLRPRDCMEVYGGQIEPVLRVILEKRIDEWDAVNGAYYERAVARAEVTRWRAAQGL